jgi:tricorn protease
MRPYLVTLQRELRSPFVPEPEALPDELKEKVAEAQAEKDQEQAPKGPPDVRVDLEGITRRAVAFPVAEGRYGRVAGTHEGVVFSAYPVEGTRRSPIMAGAPEANGSIHFYHFSTHKGDTLVDGVSDFEVTADGKTLLYRAGDRVRVIKAGDKPSDEGGDRPGRESGWLDLDRAKVSVDPKAEWRQMFGEAWRLQREQFWTPDMGGVDWNAVYARYAPLVDRIGSRGELSDLIWEMQGELGSSHAYEFGGEYRPHPEYRQGFLGVDWRYDAVRDRYVITHLVTGDSWDADSTSPLLAPGINVAEGDAVLAVNGQRVSRERGPRHLLVNQAKREVQLLIEPAAGGEARTVSVVTLADEHPARYRDWVNANRRAVHEATQGRVGYIHLPDMAYDGFAEFHRQYLTEFDHDGLIVDVRWNGGGMVSQLVLEKLARRRIGYDFQRWGQPTPYFKESRRGPVVALTDEHAGSDGDIFSHVFKLLGLGPLIGKRTWGGVVGIDPYIPLADGTVTTQPEFAFWFQDVGWGVENYGTDPTIEVDYAPQDYAHGRDPQLARGIAEALKLVAEHQTATPTPGPHPNRAYHPVDR